MCSCNTTAANVYSVLQSGHFLVIILTTFLVPLGQWHIGLSLASTTTSDETRLILHRKGAFTRSLRRKKLYKIFGPNKENASDTTVNLEVDTEQQAILITSADNEVAQRVASRQHEVGSLNVWMYTPKKETANVKGLTHPAPAVEKEEETLCSVIMTGQHHQLGTASTCVSAEHVTFWESSPMGNANFIIGKLQLVIKHGDITEEDTDAIVSGTKGKLATRLREKFGRALEEQYAAKRADLQQQGIAVTGTYGPKNIAIIYMDGSHFPRDLAEGIKACLDAAEQWGLRIISLPALGAGAGELSVSDSAQALVNAVVNKYQDGSGSIDEARLVLNDMKMIPKFVSTVKHVISQSIGSVRHVDIRHTLKKESFSNVKSDLAGGQIPSFWEYHRPNETVKIVHLLQASSEYQTVKAAFRATVRNAIKRIARIQNPYLYHMYMAKKAQMEKQNPDIQNERSLWHGTAQDAIHNINRHGFSRSYCGKNATAYGDGVYFAVDACYSARPTYSRPDSAGSQYMYLCKVLVGHSTLGSHGMRVLPFRQWSVCYDSATDNPSCPSMYVIFHDAQVYPEYLIVFQ